MPSPSFLAIDLGAASGRAILGRLESDRLHTEELYRFANGMLPVEKHLHWDVFRLLKEIRTGLAVCAEKTRISSFALDTWGVDFGLLDQNGEILGMPFAYRDAQTQGAMEEFFKILPKKRIYSLTGIQFLPFNSLYQLFAMKRAKSAVLEKAHDLLFIPDLFHYFLTGEKKTEFTFATTSQLCNPIKMGWEDELFDALEISKSLMQEIVQPGTLIGKLDKKITQGLGWGDVPVVAVASHDTGSAVAAVPSQGKDWAFISSGTWSVMGVEIRNPIINDLALQLNFTNEGGVLGSFRFLKNITGLWLEQKCREVWEREMKLDYGQLMAMAHSAKPFLFFIDPDWEGFLHPADMPMAIQDYCLRTDQKLPGSHAEFARGIYESLALKYRVVLDEIRQLMSSPIQRVHVIGGGAKNRILCQFTANATGLPVYAGPAEATSIGNIMMQSMARGCFQSLTQMREVIRNSIDVKVYEPLETEDWERAYGNFQKIISTELNDENQSKD
jgi:rhamnulokinase